ncbi:hypothetical protein [Photorhabdus asymbiotica]|uniref:hypothetical protein n=1 Tax=Photorhabdus asymbiotica TaxID=291112 RepID=UPI003DA72A43
MNHLTSKDHYISTFIAAKRRLVIELASPDSDPYLEPNAYDDYGTIVDTTSSIDIFHCLVNVEGEIMTVVAMNNLSIGTDVECPDDFGDLTENEVLLLDLACDLGRALRNSFYLSLLKYSASARKWIGNIVNVANRLFAGGKYETLFQDTFMREAHWHSVPFFNDYFDVKG